MKIKFLRPVQGLAYFEGDVTEVPDSRAARLVNAGWAILIPETEGTEQVSQLPGDIPARELLISNGLETIDDVKNAIGVLTDFDGIGKRTAEKIKLFVNEL